MVRSELLALWLAAAFGQSAAADQLVLADGSRIPGRAVRMDAEAIEWDRCGIRASYLRAAVRSLEFASSAATCTSAGRAAADANVPAGTRFLVKLSRPFDPDGEPDGQVLGGVLVEPVVLGERLFARRGAPVLVQLEASESDGRRSVRLTAVQRDQGWATFGFAGGAVERAADAAASADARVFILLQPFRAESPTAR